MLFVSLICKKATADLSSSMFSAYYVVFSEWLSQSKEEPAEDSFTITPYRAFIVRAPSLNKKSNILLCFLEIVLDVNRKGKKPDSVSLLNTLPKGTILLNRELWHATHFKAMIQHGKFHRKSCSVIHEVPRVKNVCKTLTIHLYGT